MSVVTYVPDLFPVVVPKKAAEPLVLPVVALTRSQAGCAPALTLPVNDDINSQVDPDMLSGRVMESSNQVLLEVVPFVDRDGCPTGWLETEIDDIMMEKFVLVPEMSLIGSMTSAAVPTFLPALSEVCSLAVLAGGGGGRCCGKHPGSGRVRYSVSVCPTGCWKRTSDGLCWEWRLRWGRFEGWPVVSPNGFGGNPASFAR